MGAVGRRTVFSGLLSMIDLDFLQIPGECIQICRGVKHPPLPPDYGLTCSGRLVFFLLRRRMEFEEQFLFTPDERATLTHGIGGGL